MNMTETEGKGAEERGSGGQAPAGGIVKAIRKNWQKSMKRTETPSRRVGLLTQSHAAQDDTCSE